MLSGLALWLAGVAQMPSIGTRSMSDAAAPAVMDAASVAPPPGGPWWRDHPTADLRLVSHEGCWRPGLHRHGEHGRAAMTFLGTLRTTITVRERDLRSYPRDGDPVEARWRHGGWYRGTVGRVFFLGDCVTAVEVRWADGSSPESVDLNEVRPVERRRH